jgi:hypothetical protein
MQMVRHVVANTEDVGTKIYEEARKMHYKESPERSIRGHTTADEAESLREEGIEVLSLPAMPHLKNTLQ